MADTDIAVVGMACRFPGAPDLEAFWRLLRDSREARVELDDEQLAARGVPPELLADPDYVKAAMLLDGIDRFDAGFFGMSPRDAALFDPQHRVWLEVCHEAFEHAGHVPDRFGGRIGVWAGCGMNTYLLHNVLTNPDLVRQIGMFLIRHTGNDKDFLATRTSYQFDLRGPSVNVLTACSTSLVAIHAAAQSLLAGECDMALAGGVTILVPQDRGYLFKDGEVLSSDGHCRTFDADSKGTIFGSGAGVVVLRRLQDAIEAGDHIHAVVKGSAINNDGARKVSYLAPSVDGYAEVVAEALALADTSADRVQYVEAHGTGTSVGDPIEIEALTQAFRASTDERGFCGIGSVKTNIGHLDTAAGVAGFLKVVLALQHGELPASLNYRRSNPLIDFPSSPFHVVAERRPWPRPAGGARLAGVSALGVGGTNAHVLVGEAEVAAPAANAPYPRRCHLLPIRGKVEAAAVDNARALGNWLVANPAAELADVAWTLQTGRRDFAVRGFVVGADGAGLAAQLLDGAFGAQLKKATERAPKVVFLFPGGGAQYPGMARGLYEHEPVFRAAADECLRALPTARATAVRELLFGGRATAEHGSELEQPSLALPALFLVEYALARTLLSFGVVADAMLGHSMGEYVAATLNGTFTPQQGMQVVLLRGELFEQLGPGAMLTVALPLAEALQLGGGELSIAAANAPQLSVLAGTPAAIERTEAELRTRGVDCQRLHIPVAAHSHLLDPILERFRQGLRALRLQPAKQPWVSNVTGDWIDPQRAADPDYWVEHLRSTVRFQDGIATLLATGDRVFVEIGPGKALASLARMHERAAKSATLVSLPHPKDQKAADVVMLEAVGRLWQLGVPIDWNAFHGVEHRRRVPLPTYAFQRQRHWIEPGSASVQDGVVRSAQPQPPVRLPAAQWLQQPHWRAQELAAGGAGPAGQWLVVGDGAFATAFVAHVQQHGGRALRLPAGDLASVERTLQQGVAGGFRPQRVLFAAALDRGEALSLVQSLLALWQALGRADLANGLRVLGLTHGAVRVAGEAIAAPGQAAVAGFLRVVPREYPDVRTRCVDVDTAALSAPSELAAALCREAEAGDQPLGIALRGGRRFVQELVALPAPATNETSPWRQQGVYLLTGGLGGIGLAVAEHLATAVRARLVLVGRRGLPPRACWDEWLQLRHGDRTAAVISKLRELEARGAEVEVVAADVATADGARLAVGTARQRFGALHGIVHAAGVLDDGPIQIRQPVQSERMLAPKLGAAAALDAATADAALDLFVVFASTSGLAGVPGQCDYAAANAALDAFAHWRQAARPGRTLAVDWGMWQDAGMLAAGPQLQLPAPSWLGTRSALATGVEFARSWSGTRDWQLAEHAVRGGDPVLPGTGHLELMTAALQVVEGTPQVALHGVEFLSPLVCQAGAERTVFVTVTSHGGGHEVVVASAPAGGAEHERVTHARARGQRCSATAELRPELVVPCSCLRPAPATSDQDRHVAFGPRWQCVQAVRTDATQALGELRLPDAFAADLEQHRLHPALVDMAFGCGIRLLSATAPDALFVPVGIGELRVHGRLSAEVISHVRLVANDERARLGTLDVTVTTRSGVVLVELLGLQLYGVRGAFGGTAPVARPPAPAPAPRQPATGPVPRLRAILARGITAPEGMAGLERALRSEASQVVVSSLDVAAVAAWLSLPPEAARPSPGAAGADPTVAAATGDGPRDEVEQKLAMTFHELLGVEHPGLDQDFFELGGHSLLAVRLFARIHKEFGLDLELATLLGAGTVRKLAAVVRSELKLPEPGRAPVRSVAAKKGQFVVPIRTGGKRPNLFLVHGAGGNVLGFRDLAHYFGDDQPVYGLQARGVDGKQSPHGSIAEMADAYLAELREVQPHGPYYLGGYSGGGLIAFEMAQRLRALGEAVPFVGMIDTWCPQLPQRGKLARGLLHVGRLLRRGPLYPLRILQTKWQRWTAARINAKAREDGGVMPADLRGFEVQFAFERAFEQHQVSRYEGPVWLFRAEEQPQNTRYVFVTDLGWQPYVGGGLTVVRCPGNHFTMCTEPNVQLLCREMMTALDAILAAAAPVPAASATRPELVTV
ncbi:MAG: SDR family NAD(P)-dependent oxidoreductase [Planctomycetes bacterium]|jgi:acyl transferase domain-containing protein/thioesterase domain-containing protein/acyl carrier protein|nr:SDR family NAD(P)-dependent oxidoreductase [Planctomycetota bacterium]